MSLQDTQQRWDSFLKKIKDRFHETLQKSETVLPLLFEATDFETTTFQNAWQGIYSQALDLTTKIHDVWDEKVEDAFSDAGLDENPDQLDIERNKGYHTKFELEQELRSYEVRIFAEAAKKLTALVKEVLSKDFSCTQCQAPLPVKDNFYRSYYSTCHYCQTVNTFEPGSKARNVEHFAINALGEEAGLSHQLQYEKLRFENYLSYRDIHSKEILVAQYEKYIKAYLKKRIEIIPDYQERYEKDLEAKLSFIKNYS